MAQESFSDTVMRDLAAKIGDDLIATAIRTVGLAPPGKQRATLFHHAAMSLLAMEAAEIHVVERVTVPAAIGIVAVRTIRTLRDLGQEEVEKCRTKPT